MQDTFACTRTFPKALTRDDRVLSKHLKTMLILMTNYYLRVQEYVRLLQSLFDGVYHEFCVMIYMIQLHFYARALDLKAEQSS